MEKLTKEEKKRLKLLRKEIVNELDFDIIFEDKKINKRLQKILSKVQKHIELRCKEIRNNNFQKFIKCIRESDDFGVNIFDTEINNEKRLIIENNEACMIDCLGDLDSLNLKTDIELKDCYKDCFNTIMLSKFDTIHNKINMKLDEVSSKLI